MYKSYAIPSHSLIVFVILIAILAVVVVLIVVTIAFDIHVVFVIAALPIFTFNVGRTEGNISVPFVEVERVEIVKRVLPTR